MYASLCSLEIASLEYCYLVLGSTGHLFPCTRYSVQHVKSTPWLLTQSGQPKIRAPEIDGYLGKYFSTWLACYGGDYRGSKQHCQGYDARATKCPTGTQPGQRKHPRTSSLSWGHGTSFRFIPEPYLPPCPEAYHTSSAPIQLWLVVSVRSHFELGVAAG